MTTLTKNRKIKHRQSSRLYASPDFIIGLGSIFNIAGNYFDYNYSKTGAEADRKAIKRDWEMLGHDFKSTLCILNNE